MKPFARVAGPAARGDSGRGEVAGVFRRFAACFYDAVMLAGVLFAATAALLPFNSGVAFRPGQPLYSAMLAALIFTYFGWFWRRGGQTPGMRAWRIRLDPDGGGALPWRSIAVRLGVGCLTLGLGTFGLWFGATGYRTLQDIVAGTAVRRTD